MTDTTIYYALQAGSISFVTESSLVYFIMHKECQCLALGAFAIIHTDVINWESTAELWQRSVCQTKHEKGNLKVVLDETITSGKISYIIVIGFWKLNQNHSQERMDVIPGQFIKLSWFKETLLYYLLTFWGRELMNMNIHMNMKYEYLLTTKNSVIMDAHIWR